MSRPPSYFALAVQLERAEARVSELKEEAQALRDRIYELETELVTRAPTSSKPQLTLPPRRIVN